MLTNPGVMMIKQFASSICFCIRLLKIHKPLTKLIIHFQSHWWKILNISQEMLSIRKPRKSLHSILHTQVLYNIGFQKNVLKWGEPCRVWRNNIFVDASNIKSSSINRTITDVSGTNRSNTADTTTTAEVDVKKVYLRRVVIDAWTLMLVLAVGILLPTFIISTQHNLMQENNLKPLIH